jgi:alkaline phosphatase D
LFNSKHSLRTLLPRLLITVAGAVAGTLTACQIAPSIDSTRDTKSGFSILQGATSANETTLSVVHRQTTRLTYFVRGFEPPESFKMKNVSVTTVSQPGSDWSVSTLEIDGLQLGRAYTLEVKSPDGQLLDQREFQTLDVKKPSARILVASCLKNDPQFEPDLRWTEALSHKPDLIFLLGDTIYASHLNMLQGVFSDTEIWQEHVSARNALALYRQPRLTPIFAGWDDGDYGKRDGDLTFPLRQHSARVFQTFFPRPQRKGHLTTGPGNGFFLTAFGANFAFLDARSFRSPKGGPSEAETQWGPHQEEWLFANLKARPHPTVLIEGDQFFGDHHQFESYAGQRPTSFKKIMAKLKKVPQPILFFSGDRHLSEISSVRPPEWPYQTYELTSSPIHARTYADTYERYPNPRLLAGRAGITNYAIVDFSVSGIKKASLTVEAFGPNKQRLYRESFSVRR